MSNSEVKIEKAANWSQFIYVKSFIDVWIVKFETSIVWEIPKIKKPELNNQSSKTLKINHFIKSPN